MFATLTGPVPRPPAHVVEAGEGGEPAPVQRAEPVPLEPAEPSPLEPAEPSPVQRAEPTQLDALEPAEPSPVQRAEPTQLDALVRALLAEQESAGLEPLTDGQLRHGDLGFDVALALEGVVAADGRPAAVDPPARSGPILLDEWRFAAGASTRAVKQAVPGPYTLGRLVEAGSLGRGRVTLAIADALAGELRDLAAAGCPLVEVEEPAAVAIGSDEVERRLFREAHERLLDGVGGMHTSLAIVGGEVEPAGVETLLAPPYASILLDLIRGPDGWRIIAAAPRERGVVCGVMPVEASRPGDLALMVWAAHYAASTEGRGLARVGLSTAGGLGHLPWEAAVAKARRLGAAARLAAGEGADVRRLRGLPGVPVPGRPPRVRPRRPAPRPPTSGR